MKLCEDCPDYANCTKLCPAAEEWVNKSFVKKNKVSLPFIDEIYRKGFFINYDIDYHSVLDAQIKHGFSQKIFDILFTYHVDGKNQVETATIVEVSQQYISKVINKYPL